MNHSGSKDALSSIGVSQYFSQEFFELEKPAVWRNSWLLAGRSSDLVNPGDYVVFELEVIDVSILIVRGKDEKLRAFYNACVHQGARLSYGQQGSCSRLRCSYHGWVYDFEGQLSGVPFEELFPGLEKNQLRLKEIELDTWGGFVFVHLADAPQHTLRETLAALPDELERYLAQEDWQWHAGYKGLYRTNWKTFVDNQCEGHHANFLHARSIGAVFELDDIPHSVFPDSPGILSKIEVSRPKNSSEGAVRQSDISRIAAKYSHHGMWTEKDGTGVTQKYAGALNRKNCQRWVFDLYVVFPNVVFLFEDDQFVVQRIWPVAPGLTTWELDHFYVGQPDNFADTFNRELSLLQQLDTASEDTSVAEGIYRNYASGVIDRVYLSDLQESTGIFQKRIIEKVEAVKKSGDA